MNDEPKAPSAVAKAMRRTIGQSGTLITGGYISNEEYNRRLQGKQALKIYDIMRRSEESVRAALQMVKLPIYGLERRIEPASDDERDRFIADFVNAQLFDNRQVNFNQVMREMFTFLDFGHSVTEKTYDAIDYDGKTMIGLVGLGYRKQTSIEKWQTEDKKPGITQLLLSTDNNTGTTRASIPMQKLIVCVHDKEGDNWEGISLLRYAYKSWDMADKLGLVHAIGLEKMAIPTPVITMPKGVSAKDEDAAIDAIQQYTSNEAAYIKKPAGWELDTFDLSGQTIDQLLPALQHYETKILLSVLGQFLMLGTSGSGGSRAVSQDHSKLFMLSEEAVNRVFLDAIQEQLINQLVDLNFTDLPNGYPKIVSSPVKEDDITALADALQKLKGAGLLTPTFETENYVRDLAKMPKLDDTYEADYEKMRDTRLNPPEPVVVQPPNAPAKPVAKTTKAAIIADANRSAGRLIDCLLR